MARDGKITEAAELRTLVQSSEQARADIDAVTDMAIERLRARLGPAGCARREAYLHRGDTVA